MTRSLRIAGAVALLACANALQAQKADPNAKPQPPLAPMAAQHVLVLPVQLLRADSGAWVSQGPAWEKFRRELDDSIGSVLAARGLPKAWKYAPDAVRIAKRNPDYVNDPYTLGAQTMRAVVYKIGDPLPMLFVSNLRPLIALADARYALVPIEIWFVTHAGQQIAVLKLAIADGQAGTIVWIGEVGTDPSASPTLPPNLINTLANRIANLVVAP